MTIEGFKTQVASDLGRDGLGLELLDAKGQIMAEVFRCDKDNTLRINTFNFEVPTIVLQQLLSLSLVELGSFEDGTPLSDANSFPPVLSKTYWG